MNPELALKIFFVIITLCCVSSAIASKQTWGKKPARKTKEDLKLYRKPGDVNDHPFMEW